MSRRGQVLVAEVAGQLEVLGVLAVIERHGLRDRRAAPREGNRKNDGAQQDHRNGAPTPRRVHTPNQLDFMKPAVANAPQRTWPVHTDFMSVGREPYVQNEPNVNVP